MKYARELGIAHRHGLVCARAQMHFDTPFVRIVPGFMCKRAQIEVALQLPIDPPQQVEIERRGYTRWIIVSFEHRSDRFHQIVPDEQSVTLAQPCPYLRQKIATTARIKVSDRAAKKQDQDRRSVARNLVQ